jgi:hypothetical protein
MLFIWIINKCKFLMWNNFRSIPYSTDYPVKWSEVEWSGVEWSGVEWSAVMWSVMEWSGVQWCEMKWSGVEWSGVEGSAVEWSGVEWSEVKWSGAKWNEVKWSEVKRTTAKFNPLHSLDFVTFKNLSNADVWINPEMWFTVPHVPHYRRWTTLGASFRPQPPGTATYLTAKTNLKLFSQNV